MGEKRPSSFGEGNQLIRVAHILVRPLSADGDWYWTVRCGRTVCHNQDWDYSYTRARAIAAAQEFANGYLDAAVRQESFYGT